MSRNLAVGLIAFAIVALGSTRAYAQYEDANSVTEEKQAEALELFQKGRAMMQEAGKLDDACTTLTSSYDLHKRGDTLLNLAECHRRQGKTATAWREFDEAIRYAEAVEFTEAIAAAAKLRDDLAKELSKLIVEVPSDFAAQPTLVVILDGKKLPKEQWGQQLFVDPGLHAVTASAEGYEPFDGSTEVKKLADRAVITVAMKKVPAPPEPPPPPAPKKKVVPPPPPPKEEPGGVPAWSVIVGGAGVAMLGVSVAFGVDTVNVKGELDDACGAERKSCPGTYDFESARTNELRSYGLFVGMGVAGIGATTAGVVGLVLGLTETNAKDVAISPWVSPAGAGVGVAGRFQ
jgi:hypothetical protein